MSGGRIVTGVEADRIKIRSAALSLIEGLYKIKEEKGPPPRRDWLAPPPLSVFTNMEPMNFGFSDREALVCDPNDIKHPSLVWPLDVATIKKDEGGLSCARISTVMPREARGCVDRFSPYMVRMDARQMTGDSQAVSGSGVYSWIGGKWCHADSSRFPSTSHQDAMFPAAMMSMALTLRYKWAVSVGRQNGPSIRFVTDPTGIKEIFKFRDLPEGRDRREALLRWVSDHWRQTRTDPDVEAYVRKHMRGKMGFSWEGMSCSVLPAQFDLEQCERLAAERAAMRAAGTDRRFREDVEEVPTPAF